MARFSVGGNSLASAGSLRDCTPNDECRVGRVYILKGHVVQGRSQTVLPDDGARDPSTAKSRSVYRRTESGQGLCRKDKGYKVLTIYSAL